MINKQMIYITEKYIVRHNMSHVMSYKFIILTGITIYLFIYIFTKSSHFNPILTQRLQQHLNEKMKVEDL